MPLDSDMLIGGEARMLRYFKDDKYLVSGEFFKKSSQLHATIPEQRRLIYEVSFDTSLGKALKTLRTFCIAFDLVLFLSLAVFSVFVVLQTPLFSLASSVESFLDLFKIVFLAVISIPALLIAAFVFFLLVSAVLKLLLWIFCFFFSDLCFLKFVQEDFDSN